MQRIVRSMTVPERSPALRLPSFPSMHKTAVLQFSLPNRLAVNSSDTKLVITPQATYPVWSDTTLSDTEVHISALTYKPREVAAFAAMNFTSPYFAHVGPHAGTATTWNADGVITNVGVPGMTVTGGTAKVIWEAPILGFDTSAGEAPFIYVSELSSSWAWQLQCAAPCNTNAAADYTVAFEVWVSPGSTKILTTTVQSNANWQVAYTPSAAFGLGPGWIRPISATVSNGPWPPVAGQAAVPVLYVYSTSGGTSITMTGSATSVSAFTQNVSSGVSAFMPNPIASAYWSSDIPFMSTRVTATALSASNVTKVLNKEGVIMCGRVNPESINPFQIDATYLRGLHPSEQVQLPMEKGLRTFCSLGDDFDSFRDYTISLNIYVASQLRHDTVPLYHLGSKAFYNYMIFQDPDGGSVISFTASYHIEFQTTTILWPIRVSQYKLEDLHSAVRRVAAGPFFYPNGAPITLQNVFARTRRAPGAGWAVVPRRPKPQQPANNKPSKKASSKKKKATLQQTTKRYPRKAGTQPTLPPAHFL